MKKNKLKKSMPKVSCVCGYGLSVPGGGGRSTCSNCKRVWMITVHGDGNVSAQEIA
jgi:hypothetical protein